MYTRTSTATRLAALIGASAVILTAGAFPANAASDGDVEVVNTETVQAYTDATGKVQSKRIYEQLALTGNGTVDLANPITTSGLRNLDGFGGFDVKGGEQMVDVKVDGRKNLRSVSDFKGDLPLEISVVYKLDGKEISPKSLVGKSGELEVLYTVKNVTGRTETVSFTDGKGGTVEKELDVIVPMVGSLTVGLPSNFRDVKSGQANMAGDGEGGTKLSFTMTLLAPLGSDTATFGYTAQVDDAIAPGASVSALPVNPLESPSFKTAGESYKGGASTGEELAAGAAEIDANLLKLRDGAGDLLAGLIKLRNGAQELRDGLQDEAAPGAARLADGAGQLADGTGELKAGTTKLADGAGQLADGSQKLSAGATKAQQEGSAKIAAGQAGLLEGLQTLKRGVQGIDESVDAELAGSADYQKLVGTLGKIVTGIGTPTDATPATLLGGLNLLKGGLGQLTGAEGLPKAKGGVDLVKQGLDAAVAENGSLDQLIGGLTLLKTFSCTTAAQIPAPALDGTPLAGLAGLPGPVQCDILTGQLRDGATASKTSLTEAAAGLGLVSTGLAGAIAAIDTQLVPGVDGLKKALFNASCDPAQTNPAAADFCGISQALSLVKAGIPVLVDTVVNGIQGQLLAGLGSATAGCDPESTLICAAAALAAGGSDLDAGLGDLSDGAAQLRDGLGQLDAGGGDLDAGASKLNDGAGQLADGSNQLADGLSAAAGGSGLLADGLVTAAGGAPKLVDGAGRLSDEGTKKLVEAGEDTAQTYGQQYALLVAGAKRAQDEKMVVGAPADSVGLAAYSFEIKPEDGEGNRNLMRGIAGLALLGAGGAVFGLRRRLI